MGTYQDNILNKFDTYTYKWKIKMVNLQSINTGGYVIAESGVENEISIESVTHDYMLAFVNANRSPEGSHFAINLSEPNAVSLFTRIKYASTNLGIPNSLEAGYELTLDILARNENGDPIRVENTDFKWITKCFQIDHSFNGTGSSYQMLLIEQKETIYETQDHKFNADIDLSASSIGEFATKLTKTLNDQERNMTNKNLNKFYPTEFEIKFPTDWNSWSFALPQEGEETGASQYVSDEGGGYLNFKFPSGTSITQMMAVAILHTDEMRKIHVDGGGTVFEQSGSLSGSSSALARLPLWFVFDNDVEFIRFDTISGSYQRKLKFNMIKYKTPELITGYKEHDELINSILLQKERLSRITSAGLLRKRYDYYFTGLNTEVTSFDISLNNAYYAISPLSLNDVGTNFQGNPSDSNSELNTRIAEIENEIEQLKTILRDPLLDPPLKNQSQDRINVLIRQQEELREQGTDSGEFTTFDQDRYITQSDLNKDSIDPIASALKFHHENFNSLSTNGPDKGVEGDFAAARLGAIELNTNSLRDLIDINLGIRGDPYWLGHPNVSQDVFKTGGPCFFLNVNLPTYSENQDVTARPSPDYNIVGLYRVYRIQSVFSAGKWEMRLQAYRDLNTNISLIYDNLQSGELVSEAELRRLEDAITSGGAG